MAPFTWERSLIQCLNGHSLVLKPPPSKATTKGSSGIPLIFSANERPAAGSTTTKGGEGRLRFRPANRDMGAGRSLRELQERVYGRKEGAPKAQGNGHITRWSSEHDWVARCRAYDEHLDALNLARVEEGREVAFRRLATMREKALRALEKMLDDPDNATGPQLSAIREVLDRTGVALPKGVDVTSKGEKVGAGLAELLAMSEAERKEEARRIAGVLSGEPADS